MRVGARVVGHGVLRLLLLVLHRVLLDLRGGHRGRAGDLARAEAGEGGCGIGGGGGGVRSGRVGARGGTRRERGVAGAGGWRVRHLGGGGVVSQVGGLTETRAVLTFGVGSWRPRLGRLGDCGFTDSHSNTACITYTKYLPLMCSAGLSRYEFADQSTARRPPMSLSVGAQSPGDAECSGTGLR